MVNQSPEKLDTIFSALSDPTRRAILEHLSLGEASVTEVAAPFTDGGKKTLPAISKHLRILEEAGLIVRRREGRIHNLSLAAAPMSAAAEWLAYYRQFWEEQLDSLDHYLRHQEARSDDSSST